MRSAPTTPGTPRRLLALALALLVSLPAAGLPDSPSDSPLLGRLLAPGETRVVVRREVCRCAPDGLTVNGRELVLLTVGSDTFLNDVLSRAGAESVTANLHQDWPRLSLEFVIERDPDYLVLPRTFGLEAALARLAEGPPWGQVRAVEERRIVWLEDAVLRPGPRIVEVIEELARVLHPEIIFLEAATN